MSKPSTVRVPYIGLPLRELLPVIAISFVLSLIATALGLVTPPELGPFAPLAQAAVFSLVNTILVGLLFHR